MKKLMLIITLSIISYSLLFGEIRYVSHSGTSTPPYTSWETAADSIQKCVDYSLAGDTIYVANGVYEEKVNIENKFLTLIGSSTDSCIIDARSFEAPSNFDAVRVVGGSNVSCFYIKVSTQHYGSGLKLLECGTTSLIKNNIIENCSNGAYIFNSHLTFKHNLITNAKAGVHLGALNANYFPVVDSNVIVPYDNFSTGIEGSVGTSATIRNNLIYCEMGGSGMVGILQPLAAENNAVIKNGDGIYGYYFALGSGIISNNHLYGNSTESGFHVLRGSNKIVNNNIVHSEKGYEFETPDTIKFHYNNVWDVDIPFSAFTADSTNIIADPMFVNEDSSDFHLQMFSPLIDAGDPEILDKDGSRSDIGLYGGPLGEIYTYQDLDPRPPVNLSASLDTNYILIKWNKNTEADFNHYSLYGDTTENFTLDSTTFVASIEDTFYLHIIPSGITNLYFKLTAVDNQGNESMPSEELHVSLTGTIKNEQFVINNYKLFQNYPNPFNPTTRIGYRLKEGGYVKLMVYDIKGELVEVLVNQYQERGYYEVEFRGGERSKESGVSSKSLAERLASGIYLYRIEVINESHIPVFTDVRKMVFLK